MFNQNQALSISFTPLEKSVITCCLDKFDAYNVANEIKESIRTEGDTVLTAAEALILAGLLRQWYPMLADRLTYHPAIWHS